LRDLIRRGLADDRVKSYEFWDRMAARMVDAQAGSVARWLRALGGLPFQGYADWVARLLDEVARMYLLADSYTRIETLPPETQEDIRTLIGWSYKQDDLLQQPGLSDTWIVMSQHEEVEDKLRARRVWLHGLRSGRQALLLEFAHGSTPFTGSYFCGQLFDGELVYYPSAYPQRVIIKQFDRFTSATPNPLAGYIYPTIEAALEGYASAIACNPWLQRFPVSLQQASIFKDKSASYLQDDTLHTLPVAYRPTAKPHSHLFETVGGGRMIPIFGEWDGYEFYPLALYADGIHYQIRG
jgi:hypothetical protein